MTDVDGPAPEVYRLSMEKLPVAVARAWRLAVVQVFAAATALTAALTARASSPHEAADTAMILGTLALVALPYVLWRAGRRVRRYWNAFEAAIGPTTVRVAAKGEGRVTIKQADVSAIREGVGGLVVRSVEPGVAVRIPRTAEAYADARARLAAVRPIQRKAEALPWTAGLLLAGLAVALVGSSARVAPGLGIALVLCQAAVAVFVAGELRSSPLLAPSTRSLAVAAAIASSIVALAGLFLR
jgi:hypothetical protein